jgi:hypothetical protein
MELSFYPKGYSGFFSFCAFWVVYFCYWQKWWCTQYLWYFMVVYLPLASGGWIFLGKRGIAQNCICARGINFVSQNLAEKEDKDLKNLSFSHSPKSCLQD